MEFKDYYKILGVSKNASLENIKIAYKKLSKKFHPDVNNGDKFFEERFKEIQEAYEILSDISKRKQYDYIKNTSTNNKEYEEKLSNKEDEFRKQEENFLKREEIIIQKEKKINERENIKNNEEQSSTFIILIFFLILILFAIICSNIKNQKTNTTNSKIIERIASDTIINEVKSSINQSDNLNDINIIDKKIENKFLITNKSVGFFKIGNTWNKIAKNEYEYQTVQGYGTCVDAACDGGFDLGKNLVTNEYGFVENPEITIGALLFKTSESFDDENERNKYINNKDVFYSTSNNLNAWFWKDKISYLLIFSEEFKTKEGIGVGITLEKLEEALGKLEIKIGWLEEDGNAIQIKVNSYPDIRFILNVDDAIGGYEKLSTSGKKVIISDFKKNTKIKRIIINIKAKE